MPTPDIIVKRRVEEIRKWLENCDRSIPASRHDLLNMVEYVFISTLSDREAEIVAGIEGMECNEEELKGSYDNGLANLHFAMVFANKKLSDIRTKITKGEI